jgi:hypothetical protein
MSLIGFSQLLLIFFILFLCFSDISKIKRNFKILLNYLKKNSK